MPEEILQEENQIYKFMKSNNLTDLNEGEFLTKYSAPNKAKEIHSFMVSNKLTDLDESKFYDSYLKKKDQGVSLSVSSPTQSLSPDFEKGKAFAEKGFLMKPEGTKEQKIATEDGDKQGLLLNLVSSLDKGFAKNFISSPVKGLGTILQGATKKVMGGTGEGFISDNLIKLGDYLNKTIDELSPQDEEFKGTMYDQVAQAFGQVGSLVLTGGLTGAAGKGAALVSQAPKGAALTASKTIGSQLASPTAVSAGLSMGQAEFDRAIQAGANDDQAFEAFYKNAAVGSVLETIPVMQFFKRFNNSTGGSVTNYIKTKGVAGLTGGIEEMTTEVMQQLYSNKTAKDIYNINQDILDGVGTSGGIGFGVGFLLNAMGANAKILRKQGKVQEADVLENQVKQYEDNLENPKVTSGNKVSAKDIVTQGPEIGTQKAVQNLDRDLANNVITPEQYQEGIVFAEKAAQVVDKIPEIVTGESRVKSVELLVERNDIKQANEILIQQKQITDEAYHAGIDEEIKANEEKIKKVDAEVYNIVKKPSKDFGDKKYIVDGEEVSQEAFEALQGKPIGTKEIIKAEFKEEVKPTEIKVKSIIKSKFNKPINQELLETIPEKDISDVVEKIDNGEAKLNVDVFPATDLGTDNKITNNQNVYLLHSQGKEIGVLTVNNETLGNRNESSIAGVVLHPDVKGKGIGKEIYRFVNNDLINKRKAPLKSDFDITTDAINVWQSLVKSGEAKQVGIAENGKPLFAMNKPTEVKVEEIKPTEVKVTKENKEAPAKELKQPKVLAKPNKKEAPKKTYQEAVKEKLEAEKKLTKRIAGEKAAITKEVYRKVNMMDDPRDAEEAALRYLAGGGKIRDEDINDVYGRVKRAELNTGRRELKTAEVKSKDFGGGKEKISDIAHRIWEDSGQEISEKEAEEALMSEIGNNNTRLEAAEAYLEKYSPEYLEEKTYQRQAEESEAQILEAKQKVAETNEKIKEEFKEVVEKTSKKAKEDAKKEFVDRNFEYLKQKIKIEEKCPF